MPSNATEEKCNNVTTEVREYLNVRDWWLPAISVVLAAAFSIGLAFAFAHISVLLIFAILEFGGSLFLFAIILSSRRVRTRAQLQLLEIAPNGNSQSKIARSYQFSTKSANRVPSWLHWVPTASIYVLIADFVAASLWHPLPNELSQNPLRWIYVFGFAILLISYFLAYLVWTDMTKKSSRFFQNVRERNLQPYVTLGIGILPIESRTGDTHNVVLDFDFSDAFKKSCEQPTAGEYLEVEFQAAGILVDGKKRVQLCPSSPLPATIWNCHFGSKGEHIVNVILSKVTPAKFASREAKEVLFNHEHSINVKGPLSASGLSGLTLLLTAITAAAALIQIFSWKLTF
jgi:hypothetical protein